MTLIFQFVYITLVEIFLPSPSMNIFLVRSYCNIRSNLRKDLPFHHLLFLKVHCWEKVEYLNLLCPIKSLPTVAFRDQSRHLEEIAGLTYRMIIRKEDFRTLLMRIVGLTQRSLMEPQKSEYWEFEYTLSTSFLYACGSGIAFCVTGCNVLV